MFREILNRITVWYKSDSGDHFKTFMIIEKTIEDSEHWVTKENLIDIVTVILTDNGFKVELSDEGHYLLVNW
jgi:hypothetical protein